jgi:ribosome-associated protein
METDKILKEVRFNATRSSGPGGQHVNKVETKVELRFDIPNSKILSDSEREILTAFCQGKLTKDGILIMSSQNSRFQLANKEKVTRQFLILLANAFKPRKKRKVVKPLVADRMERMKNKKFISEKKAMRQRLF